VNVSPPGDAAASRVAAAIGEPARARMLYCLMDGHARTSTELAMVAGVSPSTASVHLDRLKTEHLVKVLAQGKHRYYSLEGPKVARVLEGLSVLAAESKALPLDGAAESRELALDGAGRGRDKFVPRTPSRLLAARTCYDHMAGALAVSLHDYFKAMKWLSARPTGYGITYDLTRDGAKAFQALGIDLEATRALRRRFARACLDWSERRPHMGGALGAAFLKIALQRKWVIQDLDSRALRVTSLGRREMRTRFGIQI
jgi:DNA-binding transcriptional ArsR family regulator